MNIRKFFKSLLLLSVILIATYSKISGQAGEEPVPVLRENALKAFNEERFSDALEIFEALLVRYPRDGVFHYYQGLCLFNLNNDLERAAESLEYAFSRPNVPNDALFYLGKVYMRNYRFNEAENAFRRFGNIASRQEKRALNPEKYLRNAENAIQFTRSYNAYDVKKSAYFNLSDSLHIRQIASAGGRLVRKPDELMSQWETAGELTNLMFMPRQLNQGDYVYISGYTRNRRGGSELYRVKYTSGKRWGSPEPLNLLNTEYDEVLPYFDPVGNDLYFASKGHNSMGGFDVFKSHHDESRDKWSEPVNIGFPLNSPYNDYLLIPGANLGSLLLISDRNRDDEHVAVYNIQLKEPRVTLSSSDPAELAKIAEMGGVSTRRLAEHHLEEPSGEVSALPKKAPETAKPSETAPDLPTGYQIFLRQALANQFASDSLSRLAREGRLKAKEIPDAGKRWELQKEIIEWEKNARDFQSLADNNYQKLKEMEGGLKNMVSYPATITPDTSISGLTVYRFTGRTDVAATDEDQSGPVPDVPINNNALPKEIKTEAFNTADEPGGLVSPPDPAVSVFNRFVIMDRSPYSASNPFPLDVPLPEGAFYQIQLGVFSQQISYSNFGGISPITGETVEGRGMTRYYAGKFNDYDEAVKAQEQIKRMGYPDAFIVSWFNGQKMPVAKVRELEMRDR